ncbi:hypothetical protein GCM10023314_15010 [Algibacter agarivorans]|uniref:Uncharacterized protein n=1 Tax=Algibacter agarivorans TaxID=1109741 RepID=A0ABP9GK47_9FLAO
MKQFLIYISKVIGILIILMYGLDTLYSYVFKNGIPRNKIQKILQTKNVHYDIVFLGSSRTENHIDCALVEQLTGKSCVNFGLSGGSIGDMLILLTLADSNGVTFDDVFLQVDYNYNSKGLSNNFKASLIPFIKNTDIKKELKKDKQNFYYSSIPFYRYMKYDKVVGFRESLLAFLGKKPKINLEVGFNPKVGVGLTKSGQLPTIYNDKNEEIQSLISLMKEKRVNLKFFIAPYCMEMENRNRFGVLKSRLTNIFNYSSVFDYKEEYFFNCGHLNIDGAREFTKILIKDFYTFKIN